MTCVDVAKQELLYQAGYQPVLDGLILYVYRGKVLCLAKWHFHKAPKGWDIRENGWIQDQVSEEYAPDKDGAWRLAWKHFLETNKGP